MLKNISAAFFLRTIGAIANVLMSIVIARQLSITEAGYFFLTLTIVSILVPTNLFGTNNACLRFIGSDYSENNWENIHGYSISTLIITGGLSLITTYSLYLGADLIAEKIWNKPEMSQNIKKASIAAIFTTIYTLLAFQLQAVHKTIKSIISLSITVPLSASIFFLLFQTTKTEQAVNWLIAASAINLFLSIFFWKNSTPKVNIKLPSINSLLLACFPLWLVSIMTITITWGSQLIAASWVSPEEIAYFSAAQRTAGLISFILIAVNTVMAPHYAALYKQNKMEELKKFALKSLQIMLIFSAPLAIILLTYSKLIMSVFGEKFIAGSNLLIILAFGQLINVITGSVGYLLMMSGHEKDLRNIVFTSGFTTILLALFLIPSFGIVGAALATAFGVSLQNISGVYFVKKRLGFNILYFWK